MHYAGIEIPKEVQGKSFKDILEGRKTAEWRQSMYYHYYEYPYWHHVKPHYGIRTKHYKLAHFYYDTEVWEFYDLEKDPHELTNQINNRDFVNEISTLKDELKNLMILYQNDKSIEELSAITEKILGK